MENTQATRRNRQTGSATHNNSDAIQRRRAKVRISQKAFRERKKVAALAQERTINVMTSTLLDLTDTILQSRKHEKDGPVMRKLQETIEVFISLGTDPELQGDTNGPPEPADEDTSHDLDAPTISSGGKPSPPENSHLVGTQQRPLLPIPTLTISPGSTMSSIMEAHPIAIRLLQSTLMIGYAALTGKQGFGTDIAMRLFRYAFLYHSQEEILGNLEWFLGSGQRDIVRLWDVSFIDNEVAETASAEILQKEHSYPLLPAVDIHAFERPPSGQIQTQEGIFWNAQEVESYLMRNGARFLSPDVIELYLPPAEPAMTSEYSDRTTRNSTPERAKCGARNKTSDFFDCDALLPGLGETQENDIDLVASQSVQPTPQAQSQRLIVQASLLFQNLVNISICMAKGPAYQVQEIRGAVEYSAMQSSRVPIAAAA